jgi:hypothetical protein
MRIILPAALCASRRMVNKSDGEVFVRVVSNLTSKQYSKQRLMELTVSARCLQAGRNFIAVFLPLAESRMKYSSESSAESR